MWLSFTLNTITRPSSRVLVTGVLEDRIRIVGVYDEPDHPRPTSGSPGPRRPISPP